MRILLLAAASSSNTRSFVAGLAAAGHEVHVATMHPGRLPEATVHVLGMAGRGLRRFPFALAVPAVLRLHRKLRPAIVIGYYASSYGVLASLLPRPRVVATAGGDLFVAAQGNSLRRRMIPRLSSFALRRADLVLCWGAHLAEEARRLGGLRARILTLPRGIDTTLFQPEVSRNPLARTVVSTRSLDAFYRPNVLLEAVALLVRDGIDVALEFYGDGPDARVLMDRVASLGLAAHVRFAGRQPAFEIAAALRRAAVYASFPESEGVSASLLEAMASGTLPVVGDLPASREWIEHGANGLLVSEPAEPIAVAACLRRALEDDALRQRAFERNPEIVQARASRDSNSQVFSRTFEALARGQV